MVLDQIFKGGNLVQEQFLGQSLQPYFREIM